MEAARRGQLTGQAMVGENEHAGDDPNELFDLVDLDDRVIGQVRRGEAHGNPALIHRSVQVLILDGDGRVLLQRRSPAKDLFPGYYCASASGHVMSGDDYAATAVREVAEELGIMARPRYVSKAVVRSTPETEITALFVVRHDGPFRFSPSETAGGAFFALAEVRAGQADGSLPLTPAAVAALDELERLRREGHLASYLAEL